MSARAALLAAVALIASVATASAQARGGRDRDRDYRRADPAAVVATELAFARAAQEKGQWTAFAEYATDDAVMFVPQPVNAQAWLKGRANPAQAVRWQPHQVWSSCDGSLAVTRGAWQRADGSVGYFTTVWQREGKRKVEYRWVMDQGDVLAEPLEAPEMIQATKADCTEATMSPVPSSDAPQGNSDDETLWWSVEVKPDLSRIFTVDLWRDGEMQEVLRSEVAAPSGA
jgi:ketosteroid isomerase-like protein